MSMRHRHKFVADKISIETIRFYETKKKGKEEEEDELREKCVEFNLVTGSISVNSQQRVDWRYIYQTP